jgi:PD-(D/E)XK nuclease superfamily
MAVPATGAITGCRHLGAQEVKTTIRVSSLAGYTDCPRRSAARIFWREITAAGFRLRKLPTSIGAIIGTAVHAGAAHVLGEKAATGRLPYRTRAIDCSREALANGVNSGEVQFDAPNGPTQTFRDAVDQTTRMAGVYHDTIAPTINPIIVEERFEADVGGGVVLSGQPDLICREPGRIRDLKTGQRMPASFAPQLGAYSLVVRSHGYPIESAAIDYVKRVRPSKPQPAPVTVEAAIAHAETAAANILRMITTDINTFRNGDPYRRILPGDVWSFAANPSSVLCSAKWCPAHSTEFCHEHQK